jgi:hypothetical protein
VAKSKQQIEVLVLAGSIHHYFRAARSTRRDCLVLVYNVYNFERTRDGSHYVHGGCNLKQHFGSELRYGKAGGRKRFHQRWIGGRLHAFSPCVDDSFGLLFATVSTLFFVPAFF